MKEGKRKKDIRIRSENGDPEEPVFEERPEEIEKREEAGHWEMDTVVGKLGQSRKCLLVLTERKTRYEIVRMLKNRTTAEVVSKLNQLERQLGEKCFRNIFKTITMDNGSEFADVKGIAASRRNKRNRTVTYYCHPYSSWERGSNENNNRFIRRQIPKGINFDDRSKKEIQWIENWINDYPRAMFEGETPRELFEKEFPEYFQKGEGG